MQQKVQNPNPTILFQSSNITSFQGLIQGLDEMFHGLEHNFESIAFVVEGQIFVALLQDGEDHVLAVAQDEVAAARLDALLAFLQEKKNKTQNGTHLRKKKDKKKYVR